MSLYELGLEYLRQHDEIRKRMREIKSDIGTLSRKQQYLQRCRILALDEVATSLKITGEHLMNYYGGRNEQSNLQS